MENQKINNRLIIFNHLVNSALLTQHMAGTHYPSEMPYRCESCGYRTSSHRDVIDHYYKIHGKGEGLQCPFCLKVKNHSIK